MPLYARKVADHYPDRERPPSADDFVVLSGRYEAGSFHRIADGPSEGRWAWGAGLGAATANFVATGYATSPDECRTHIARSFRSMLARADLRERPDAKPGPPRREPAEAIDGPSGPLPPYDRENDILLGPMIRNELRITVRSGSTDRRVALALDARTGDVVVGPDRRGAARRRRLRLARRRRDRPRAFDAIAASWSRWTWWAGLEPVEPLQRGARRA